MLTSAPKFEWQELFCRDVCFFHFRIAFFFFFSPLTFGMFCFVGVFFVLGDLRYLHYVIRFFVEH